MPTSQWEDKDVGLGFTSIYNTGGNVGVGTDNPVRPSKSVTTLMLEKKVLV